MDAVLTGVLGGTFDPIHLGHLHIARQVLEQLPLASVRFIPSAVPPLRKSPLATPAQRLDMVSLATRSEPRFRVDDRELRRQGPSYTYDTVLSLRRSEPAHGHCLIVGVDTILTLDRWYRWYTLLDLVHFIVVKRPGWALPDPLPDWWQPRAVDSVCALTATTAGKIHVIDITPVDTSATRIRTALRHGKHMGRDLPDKVWTYIRENRLYE